MKKEGGYSHLRKQIGNIDFTRRPHGTDGLLRRGRDALQVIEPLHLFRRAFGKEKRSEELPKCRVFLPPALLDERQQRACVLWVAFRPAACKSTIGLDLYHRAARPQFAALAVERELFEQNQHVAPLHRRPWSYRSAI